MDAQGVQHMVDGRAALGTVATSIAASTSWMDVAEPIVTMTMTVLVGGVTLWYTVERALKLRKERKNGNRKGNNKP